MCAVSVFVPRRARAVRLSQYQQSYNGYTLNDQLNQVSLQVTDLKTLWRMTEIQTDTLWRWRQAALTVLFLDGCLLIRCRASLVWWNCKASTDTDWLTDWLTHLLPVRWEVCIANTMPFHVFLLLMTIEQIGNVDSHYQTKPASCVVFRSKNSIVLKNTHTRRLHVWACCHRY